MVLQNPPIDNGIDIVPIEGAPYHLMLAYQETTQKWYWQLRTNNTAEPLCVDLEGSDQWGAAMLIGVEAAMDMLQYEDPGFEDETAELIDPTWQDWKDYMDTRNGWMS